jgi:cytochrome c oxidase subunit I
MKLRRLIGFNLLTAVVLGIVGFYVGWWLGHLVKASSIAYFDDTGQNDISLFFAYFVGVVGFLVGLGFANYPVQRMLGKPPSLREKETEGVGRYFGLCTDHKVVGLQYFIGIGAFIFIGGLNAMLIRFELLRPTHLAWNGNNYLTLVGLHGTMMMGMMTSGIIGPFANYFVPLMIGSRRMAFPRIEALTFWLLMAAGTILMTALAFGGFPTGWTGYAPLSEQSNMGMDAYIAFFALVGISMTLLGLNMLVTVITMRAPGLSWSRLPIFVWGTVTTSVLMLLAAPVLISTLFMLALDRTAQTGFFNVQAGGSPYLYENLFWIFGHPEVYVLALPGMGIVLEILPVFARKPLWGYRLAVTGMVGIMLLSFLVWQHHLFVSGINGDLRPFYMLSTELISLPTGFIFVCALGTLWAGRIRLTVPMLFALAWIFNFLIGGLSGVFLSDVPSDVTTHGSFFSMAHFHYTIMGGLIFAFFGAVYFWLPKMTGFELNERLGKIHFWVMFIAFNSTFGPLLVIGFLGMPRRVVTYAGYLQGANDWVSVSAFVLGASMLVFLANLVWTQVFVRTPAAANPWGSKSIEFQLPSPVPVHDFDRIPTFGPDPYPYGALDGAPAGSRPAILPARPTARPSWRSTPPTTASSSRSRRRPSSATWRSARVCGRARSCSSSSRSCSRTSICGR